ncbi:MAG: hypothetical protein N3C60_00055 [Calditerrivibrio sp.]|nr:hypothetical protein [Calditerrivibrio sp.]
MMMAFEGPYIAAMIGRLPDVKLNLAGYGIAYSVGLLVEAPIIMLMSASTALVKSKQSYIKLRNFSFILIGVLTAVILIILIKPVYIFIFNDLLKLEEKLQSNVYWAIWGLVPWAGAIGYRRFYQGIMIKDGKTKYVAYGTLTRMLTVIFLAVFIKNFTKINSALLGTMTLSGAVVVEAIFARVLAKDSVSKVMKMEIKDDLNFRKIAKFYFPMAMTPLIALAVPPMTTFVLLKGTNPLESAAIMPVLNSLTFVFRAVGLSFQEVAIALLDGGFRHYEKVRNFMRGLFLFNLLGYGMISFTPMAEVYFVNISGMTPELAEMAKIPSMILTFVPPFTALLSFQRAIIVKKGVTIHMTIATFIEVIITFGMLFTIPFVPVTGIIVAATALLVGRVVSNLYLHIIISKSFL